MNTPTPSAPKAEQVPQISKKKTKRPLLERFWSQVNKTPTCWEWTGAMFPTGYGHFCAGDRKTHPSNRAHRVSWEIANGKIPEGLGVLHRCDNKRCVNPAHLFTGTQIDNAVDMVRKGKCYNRKLCDVEVLEIREAKGVSSSLLAWEYGVRPGHIREIRNGTAAIHVQ